jgi:iron complex transport system ATP-binding protein
VSEGALRLAARELVVKRRDRVVLDGLSLELRAGEALAVVGPNGAGKSTLLRALLGLLPAEGQIDIDGRALRELTRPERARRLAYVPQQTQLESALDVRDVVAQGRFAYGKSAPDEALTVERAMARAGIAGFADRSFVKLSLGEQRRVLVARALASAAPTILLDEPDAFLDVGQALDLFALLDTLRAAGHALLLVLHDLDRAHRFADRVLLLADGREAGSGPPTEVLDAARLRRVFGVVPVPGGAVGFVRAGEDETT